MFNFDEFTKIDYGFFYIALAGTLFLVLQYLFTFLGIGDDIDGDVDFDGHTDGFDWLSFGLPFNLFTFRGIVAFIVVFGWTGLSISRTSNMNFWFIFLIAFAAGLLMLFTVALIYYAAEKLGESGNIELEIAVGKQCEVYIPIPANNTGSGKVQILLGNSLKEIEAVTTGEELKSNDIVKVVSVLNDKLVVEKINK